MKDRTRDALYGELPYVKYTEEEIKRTQDKLDKLKVPTLDSFTIFKDHSALAKLVGHMLKTEGYDVEYEVPLKGLNFAWRADVAGYKDEKIHTVVEVGNLSHGAKMQVLAAVYPRFIWIPYVPVLDSDSVVEIITGLKTLPKQVEELQRELAVIKQNLESDVKGIIDKNKALLIAQSRALEKMQKDIDYCVKEYNEYFTRIDDIKRRMVKVRDDHWQLMREKDRGRAYY